MILAFILLIIFIEKCTVINIMSPTVFKKSKYNNYNYIHQGVANNNSEIVRVSDSPYNAIMYNEEENYFIIYGDEKIRKINSKGIQEFSIERNDNVSYANSGTYVFTENMVYDLSDKLITKTKIKKVIQASGEQLKLNKFLKLLSSYYQKANTVIYANVETFGAKNHKVYFKIDHDWIGIYISKIESNRINFHPSGEILKTFPEKRQHLLFLKNPVNNVYSSRSAGNETFSSVSNDLILTKEEEIEYPNNKNIKVAFYQKEKTLGVIAYTGIPTSFRGTAYFNLKINKEEYNFKEMGTNNIGFFNKVKHDISYYVVPNKFRKKTQVSFFKSFPSFKYS
ncbi:hypothetical protein [uncultured Olleya sp.]|uniref:hypothetical protein n=1 Tax=uncultured Olleya sp. TaxID=757243 RepID=UPI002598C599|nr:hypothetical protein [uncultured Olleya sp.]